MSGQIDPKVGLNELKDREEATKRLEKISTQLPTTEDVKDGQVVDFLMKNGGFITATVFRNMVNFIVIRIDGKGKGIFLKKEDIVSVDPHD